MPKHRKKEAWFKIASAEEVLRFVGHEALSWTLVQLQLQLQFCDSDPEKEVGIKKRGFWTTRSSLCFEGHRNHTVRR